MDRDAYDRLRPGDVLYRGTRPIRVLYTTHDRHRGRPRPVVVGDDCHTYEIHEVTTTPRAEAS